MTPSRGQRNTVLCCVALASKFRLWFHQLAHTNRGKVALRQLACLCTRGQLRPGFVPGPCDCTPSLLACPPYSSAASAADVFRVALRRVVGLVQYLTSIKAVPGPV